MRRPPPPGSSSSRRPVKLTPGPTPPERPPLTPPHPGPATEPPQLGGVRSSRAAALRSESPGQAPAHSSLSPGAAAAPGAREQPRLRRAEVSSVSFLPDRRSPWGPPPRSLGSFAAALSGGGGGCGRGSASTRCGAAARSSPCGTVGPESAEEPGAFTVGHTPERSRRVGVGRMARAGRRPQLASGRPRAAECEVRAHAPGPAAAPPPARPARAPASRRCRLQRRPPASRRRAPRKRPAADVWALGGRRSPVRASVITSPVPGFASVIRGTDRAFGAGLGSVQVTKASLQSNY